MKKSGKHHPPQVIKVNIFSNGINWHQESSDKICWEGHNLTFWCPCQKCKTEFKYEKTSEKVHWLSEPHQPSIRDTPTYVHSYVLEALSVWPSFSSQRDPFKDFTKEKWQDENCASRRLNWQQKVGYKMKGVEMKAMEGIDACKWSITLFQAHSHNNLNQSNGHRNGEKES